MYYSLERGGGPAERSWSASITPPPFVQHFMCNAKILYNLGAYMGQGYYIVLCCSTELGRYVPTEGRMGRVLMCTSISARDNNYLTIIRLYKLSVLCTR